MRKPLNRIAILVLLAAVALSALDAFIAWNQYQDLLQRSHGDLADVATEDVLRAADAIIYHLAYLGGLAALIEIADKILWHLRNPN
jgi:hypothetical protein